MEYFNFFSKLRNRYGYRLKMLIDSATFALLLSIALFMYEMISSANETEKIVENLKDIENSLSTRYLGLFPQYINSINGLLSEAIKNQDKSSIRDSIIIFEDVVYYGIRSDADGFRTMMENLLRLTNNGCHITLAFYDVNSIPFKQMIRDNLISSDYQKKYIADRRSYQERLAKLHNESKDITKIGERSDVEKQMVNLLNKHFDNAVGKNYKSDSIHAFFRRINNRRLIDSILTQRYYEKTRGDNAKRFIVAKSTLLRSLPQKKDAVDAISIRINELFVRLDNIKRHYIEKDYLEITYSDYYNMYKDITLAICEVLSSQPNIDIINLHESMMMCCWMSVINGKENAIFAFPSKYSTDEIGFISHDVNIARYIRTMLNGIKKGRLEE